MPSLRNAWQGLLENTALKMRILQPRLNPKLFGPSAKLSPETRRYQKPVLEALTGHAQLRQRGQNLSKCPGMRGIKV